MKLVPPRSVPGRDDKYMGLAFWHASFSKDPSTQVGCVIIGADNTPLGSGYNGPPREIQDNQINWDRPHKYDFIKHAEFNAMRHSHGDLRDATLYVTAKPCKGCMLDIVDRGIKRVIYFPYKGTDSASSLHDKTIEDKGDEIARLGRVQLIPFSGNLNWMRDRIEVMKEQGIFN
jgi:dCMP deaminase